MATYISLLRYTQKGAENIKESPARLDAAKKVFQSMGAELKQWYLVMGQYDAVVISDFEVSLDRAAKETGPDLIAIGTHGRSGLGRMVMGSVANAVMRRATLPCLLIHPSGK